MITADLFSLTRISDISAKNIKVTNHYVYFHFSTQFSAQALLSYCTCLKASQSHLRLSSTTFILVVGLLPLSTSMYLFEQTSLMSASSKVVSPPWKYVCLSITPCNTSPDTLFIFLSLGLSYFIMKLCSCKWFGGAGVFTLEISALIDNRSPVKAGYTFSIS